MVKMIKFKKYLGHITNQLFKIFLIQSKLWHRGRFLVAELKNIKTDLIKIDIFFEILVKAGRFTNKQFELRCGILYAPINFLALVQNFRLFFLLGMHFFHLFGIQL